MGWRHRNPAKTLPTLFCPFAATSGSRFQFEHILLPFVQAAMIRSLLSCFCLGLSLASAAPENSNWDFKLTREDGAGKTLARTSTTVAVIGGGREALAKLPLRISEFRQWYVRVEVYVEDKLITFEFDEAGPADAAGADPKETSPELSWFDSRQEWQGPGTYTLCAFGDERVTVRIGPQGEKDLPERKPARSLVLTRRSADGSIRMTSSVPWIPLKDSAIFMCLPETANPTIQPVRCLIDEVSDRKIFRFLLRHPASATHPATPVSHDLRLNLPEGEKPLTACEQDGETLEVQFLGGLPD